MSSGTVVPASFERHVKLIAADLAKPVVDPNLVRQKLERLIGAAA